MFENHMGEFVSIGFMALALGMDVFSVSLGLGMQVIRLKRVAFIGLVFGLFHIILPYTGIILGQVLSTKMGQFTELVGGLLLITVGLQMFFLAFNYELKKVIQPVGIGLLILALSVSVDSFSVGLSLSMAGMRQLMMIVSFGITSIAFTWLGMLIGRRVRGVLGAYSEILGGSILCGFGLSIIFG